LGETGLPDGIPFSIGIATSTETTPAELVRDADRVLYEAKADGRREVQRSGDPRTIAVDAD
jgi:PleD family two-component response regulator